MAGLLAARALAEHFERVTVLERDHLPSGAISRRGVPQGRHVHALLGAGERALDAAFPGIVADLVLAGAQYVDLSAGRLWGFGGELCREGRAPRRALMMSRP